METLASSDNRIIGHGIAGGIIAGAVFIVAEMVMNGLLGKPFFGPLRMISSIVLGREALNPSYSFAAAMLAGLVIHFVLAALFGLIFTVILNMANATREMGALLIYGLVYGVALWLVNFWLIAPTVFPQFTQINPFWNGFVAHALFYGVVLGWYAATAWPQQLRNQEPVVERQRRYG